MKTICAFLLLLCAACSSGGGDANSGPNVNSNAGTADPCLDSNSADCNTGDTNTDSNTDNNTDSDTNTDSNTNTDNNTDNDTNTDGNSDSNADGNTDSNADRNTDSNSDGNTDSNTNGDTDTVADADTDGDGLLDSTDACPNQANNGLGLDSTGCPVSVPVPQRITSSIALAQQASVSAFGGSWEVDFYRNTAYNCGLSGNYTFLVVEPSNNAGGQAPLWVYLHGGGVGYFNNSGAYPALTTQTQNSWNHEESYSDLWNNQVLGRVLDGSGNPIDNTLKRRIEEGYRLLVVAMCDHDLYSGQGTTYPNNPNGGQVNGLQATMSALEYTVANYPSTHVIAHGTSAGSVGVFSLASAFAQENRRLTAVVADSYAITPRLIPITEQFAGTSGFPLSGNFEPQGAIDKVGFYIDPDQHAYPEARIAAGFTAVPTLFLGGDADPFCAGNQAAIPAASAAGLNNCDWVFDSLGQAVANQVGSPHQVSVLDGAGHVPTNTPGVANNIVDNFLSTVLANNPPFPFQ